MSTVLDSVTEARALAPLREFLATATSIAGAATVRTAGGVAMLASASFAAARTTFRRPRVLPCAHGDGLHRQLDSDDGQCQRERGDGRERRIHAGALAMATR